MLIFILPRNDFIRKNKTDFLIGNTSALNSSREAWKVFLVLVETYVVNCLYSQIHCRRSFCFFFYLTQALARHIYIV